MYALGKDISGAIRLCNLAKKPHLLVAGATGSGKSVCLNSIIVSLIYRNSPEDLKMILIDPKRVEFSMYNGLPHLMLPNVITETDKAVNALTWAINEMEHRFCLFQEAKARNLEEYNMCQAVLSRRNSKIAVIVIIIDELADLMD
jgi:S-DNA-T family DNA segregation ATPase FtsK/SpoIIIE